MKRIVTFKLDDWLLKLLDMYAERHRMHRSEAIREAIVKLLLEQDYRLEPPREEDSDAITVEV